MLLSSENTKNADPYDAFRQWCLKNGFGDVVNCRSKDVNLRRLGQAINHYKPLNHDVKRKTGKNFSVFEAVYDPFRRGFNFLSDFPALLPLNYREAG